jgi:antitoxin ParD1/3/4
MCLAFCTKNQYIQRVKKTTNKNTSFSLGEHFTQFIDGQIADGRYGSASDVVRAGLRALEERESHLAALRAALIHGENSGPSTSFDFDAFIERKRAQARRAG